MIRLWNTVYRVLKSRQTVAMEAFLGAQALAWGAYVAWPWSDAFASIPAAYSMLAIAPEWVVGMAFAVVGSSYLRALWIKDVRHCRRSALALAVLWAWVAFSFLVTIPLSTAIPIYSANVAASLWVYSRLYIRWA